MEWDWRETRCRKDANKMRGGHTPGWGKAPTEDSHVDGTLEPPRPRRHQRGDHRRVHVREAHIGLARQEADLTNGRAECEPDVSAKRVKGSCAAFAHLVDNGTERDGTNGVGGRRAVDQ